MASLMDGFFKSLGFVPISESSSSSEPCIVAADVPAVGDVCRMQQGRAGSVQVCILSIDTISEPQRARVACVNTGNVYVVPICRPPAGAGSFGQPEITFK